MREMDCPVRNSKGLILPVALVFLMILVVMGTTATILATTDLRIGSNLKSSDKAVYVAEAGVEEARGRLKANVTDPINDGHPNHPQWSAFIGVEEKARGKGYDNGNAMHFRTSSIQDSFDYTVRISHRTDGASNILYYGDADGDGMHERNTTTGRNVYLLSSTGYSAGSQRTVNMEATRFPPIAAPGALYVEAWTTIQGNVDINGNDSCGTDDKPGIASKNAPGSVSTHGASYITGVGGTVPNIHYGMSDLNVQGMIDGLKDLADFTYTVESATHTDTTVPGPGDGWGTPTQDVTLQDPSSCSANTIIHYDTDGTGLTLSGGVTGCGILLVEGDLAVHSSFYWYGAILTTGSIIFTGGGNRNITGAIVSGGSVDGDIIGGNVNLVYCSSAIAEQTESRPLKVFSWKEDT